MTSPPRPRAPARAPRGPTVAVAAGLLVGLGAGAAASAERVRAQGGLPAWARSVEVVSSGVTVRAGPTVQAARRGTVQRGTRMPVVGWAPGGGCPGGGWFAVGVDAFVCDSLARPSPEAPSGEPQPVIAEGALLPRPHAFVSVDGTWAYARPEDYFVDDWAESLGRGFGIAVAERAVVDGVRFSRSLAGRWIPDEQLRFARGSDFEGVALEGALDVAWVAREGASIRAWRGGRPGPVVRRVARRERLRILETLPAGRVRVADGVIDARALRRPSLAAPPDGVGPDEAWIDVELGAQTLVLYEAARPVFATLVSTGRGTPGHETPVGRFRVWAKLAESTMDDLERTDLEQNYAIEAVPWVQYFAEGVALHAAFWHDDFGRPRSHGCVNLSPRDARRLFARTSPAIPPGWDAVLASPGEPGTLVQVRR